MKFKAIIFDLDGTLLDTLDDLADSCNRVLTDAGLPVHPVDSYRYFVGDGMQTLVRRILPEDKRDEHHIQLLCRSFLKDYEMNWRVKTRLYDGIDSMLTSLEAQNLQKNVLSNKPHDFTVVCVREFLGKWRFRAVLGQRTGQPRKPDPAGALEITSLLNIGPAEIVYLGDTATDMKTACAAGMYPVGALWGFREEDELRENGAELLVHHPDELMEFLNNDE